MGAATGVTTFYSVDPGGPCLGWAQWVDGVLFACGLSRCAASDWADRARTHRALLAARGAYSGVVLTECMRYRGRATPGSPQTLVELNAIAGHVGNAWVEPAQWKGCVPKEEHQPMVWGALRPEEHALVASVNPPSLRHNVVDAVGIGLYALGRLVPAPPAPKKPKRRRPHVPGRRRRRNRE